MTYFTITGVWSRATYATCPLFDFFFCAIATWLINSFYFACIRSQHPSDKACPTLYFVGCYFSHGGCIQGPTQYPQRPPKSSLTQDGQLHLTNTQLKNTSPGQLSFFICLIFTWKFVHLVQTNFPRNKWILEFWAMTMRGGHESQQPTYRRIYRSIDLLAELKLMNSPFKSIRSTPMCGANPYFPELVRCK